MTEKIYTEKKLGMLMIFVIILMFLVSIALFGFGMAFGGGGFLAAVEDCRAVLDELCGYTAPVVQVL